MGGVGGAGVALNARNSLGARLCRRRRRRRRRRRHRRHHHLRRCAAAPCAPRTQCDYRGVVLYRRRRHSALVVVVTGALLRDRLPRENSLVIFIL